MSYPERRTLASFTSTSCGDRPESSPGFRVVLSPVLLILSRTMVFFRVSSSVTVAGPLGILTPFRCFQTSGSIVSCKPNLRQ
jgi:hypothetical protein